MNKQFLCVKQPTVGSCACVSEEGVTPSECDYCFYNKNKEYDGHDIINVPKSLKVQAKPIVEKVVQAYDTPRCSRITCKCEQCQEENKFTLHFEGQGHDIIKIPEYLLEQIMDNIKYIIDNMTEEEYDEDGLTGCNVCIAIGGKNFMLVDGWEGYDIED